MSIKVKRQETSDSQGRNGQSSSDRQEPDVPVYTIDGAPEAKWEMWDPSKAYDALQHMHPRPRKVRQTKVDRIARAIQKGKWRRTGETVKQGADGLWEDGAHRWTAIIQANIPVPILTVRGVEREATLVIDSGTSRTYGDRLRMGGVTGAEVMQSIVRRMWYWDVQRSYMATSRTISPSDEELEEYRLEKGHAEELERAREIAGYARQCYLTSTTLAVIHIILMRINDRDAGKFIDQLITGAELKLTDPAYVLRRRLEKEAQSNVRNYEERMALVFTAWNQFRDGKQVTTIPLPRGRNITNRNYPIPR